jgi:NhaP-type Na+/H+ or K+/H+ antiporter
MRNVLKYVAMIIGTAVAGAVFGILAAFLLSWLMQDSAGGWGGLVGIILGLAFGYPVGVFLGMVIFKTLLRYNGSLILGLIGVIVGGALPFILAEPLGLNNYADLLWACIILSSPLLGTLGFNLRKKSARQSSVSSAGQSDAIDIDRQP